MDFYRISKPCGVTRVVAVSAIDVLFSDHPKCLDLIFIYLSGLMISNKRHSVAELKNDA